MDPINGNFIGLTVQNSNNWETFHHPFQKIAFAQPPKGFICEREGQHRVKDYDETQINFHFYTEVRVCPEGYLMHQEKCFKLVKTTKVQAEAELECFKEEGFLARPENYFDVN